MLIPGEQSIRPIRDLTANTRKAVTDFKDPQPQLRNITHQFVTYQRKDGGLGRDR